MNVPVGGSEARPALPAGLPEAPAPGDPPAPLPQRLSELRAFPGRWLGREVELVIQLRAERPSWNPYHSRFTPLAWAGFEAWPDEAFLWEPAAFADPAPYLFTARGSDLHRTLGAAPTYQRFRVVARVREVFLDEPWIELVSAERLPVSVPEGALIQAERGIEFLETGAWRFAREAFERAVAADLPDATRAELERLIEWTQRRLDEDARSS